MFRNKEAKWLESEKCWSYTAQKKSLLYSWLQEKGTDLGITLISPHTLAHTHDVWQEKAKRNISLSAITQPADSFPFLCYKAIAILQFHWRPMKLKDIQKSVQIHTTGALFLLEKPHLLWKWGKCLKIKKQTSSFTHMFYATTLRKRYCAFA